MKDVALPFLAFLLVLSATLQTQTKLVEKVTQKDNQIVIPYEKYVLPNGLTWVVHEDHSDQLTLSPLGSSSPPSC